jgi:hypothetical protein
VIDTKETKDNTKKLITFTITKEKLRGLKYGANVIKIEARPNNVLKQLTKTF